MAYFNNYHLILENIDPVFSSNSGFCNGVSHTQRVRDVCNGLDECTYHGHNTVAGDPCYGIDKYTVIHYSCIPGKSTKQHFLEHLFTNYGTFLLELNKVLGIITVVIFEPSFIIPKINCVGVV